MSPYDSSAQLAEVPSLVLLQPPHAFMKACLQQSIYTLTRMAQITMLPLKEGVREVILDTRDLKILSVRIGGQAVDHSLDTAHKVLTHKTTDGIMYASS